MAVNRGRMCRMTGVGYALGGAGGSPIQRAPIEEGIWKDVHAIDAQAMPRSENRILDDAPKASRVYANGSSSTELEGHLAEAVTEGGVVQLKGELTQYRTITRPIGVYGQRRHRPAGHERLGKTSLSHAPGVLLSRHGRWRLGAKRCFRCGRKEAGREEESSNIGLAFGGVGSVAEN
ncbi:hypothetical protein FA13DRAFT_1711004 [Coprinellus micaceus]|uniref:Uncharacterized protein n=1 Tax=Coprinellus micaceus TaxID=71717 RepID=A0A4Y7T5I2_COPMI|nr:hypothetical protein FA13DRAFT_1711004 [Coprinellus micaceus]